MKHKCSPPAVEPKIRICRFILEIGFLYLLQSPVFELLKVRQQFRRIPLDLPKTIEHINIFIFSFFLVKKDLLRDLHPNERLYKDVSNCIDQLVDNQL